jgi:acyl-CoA synthetase (AMP-forming)/AMP-acid ligase II
MLEVAAEVNSARSEQEQLFRPVEDIMGALKATVDRMGDEVFATWIEAGDRETQSFTFKQTWESAGAVAHNLIHSWGVKPGDRVILCYNFR